MPPTTPRCIGIDLLYIPRVAKLYRRYGERFIRKILTPNEAAYSLQPASDHAKIARIAGRVALKEAVSKALGVGIAQLGNPKGILWKDIEVQRALRMPPEVALTGKALAYAQQKGITDWLVSSSHDEDYATAIAYGL